MKSTRLALVMAAVAAVLSFPATSQAAVTHTFLARTERSAPSSQAASTRGCPDASGCGLYSLKSGRWPMWKGVATIAYSINPVQMWMSWRNAEAAVLTAASVWNKVDPVVRLAYLGRTVRAPAAGDGHNDIGWGRLDPGVLAASTITTVGSRIVEADIVFNVAMPWGHAPCSQRNNACAAAPTDAGMIARFQAQAIATHEIGHWMGLADLATDTAKQLTMYALVHPGDRQQATLGLGDIKGVRAAYPCRSCKMPAIYRP